MRKQVNLQINFEATKRFGAKKGICYDKSGKKLMGGDYFLSIQPEIPLDFNVSSAALAEDAFSK